MRAFKYMISIVIAIALCAGVLIYALGEKKSDTSQGATSNSGSGIVINEFMAANSSYVPDDKGNYSDWIELYNPTDSAVDLSEMGLTDDSTNIKWTFPDISLAAGGYLVVFASGDDEKDPNAALHASFKLNAASGGIYLTSASGQTVDAVEYENQSENISLGRDPQDMSSWEAFDKPTPGYSNDDTGYAAYTESRKSSDTSLKLTEVMASNQTTLADNTGAYSDYIEIYNSGSEAIDLNGYGLSDDPADVMDWKFPDVTIEPGAYLVVFASGADLKSTDLAAGAIHTSFRISSYQDTIVLSDPAGLLIDQVSVEESKADQAYERVPDESGVYGDTWETTSQPTPGYANTDEGYAQFTAANPIALGPVVISEVMASNSQYLEEENGQYYDWIELYNRSDQPVDITNYGLTDNAGNPAKWRMPQMTLSPGQYVTVLASGLADDDSVKKKYIHTSFKLSADGGVLVLYNADGVLQDKYNLSRLPYGVSVGRMDGQDSLFYFTKPTPGAENTDGLKGIVDTPEASVAGGSYDAAQTVALACDTDGAELHYTMDGTTPTESSPAYTGDIDVSKTSVIRVKAFKDGYLDSSVLTESYFINEQHSLPLISIVTDPDYLFNKDTGIYELGPNAEEIPGSPGHYQVANYLDKGQESERPASFEVFDEAGRQVFEQDIGIRIAGGFSRDNAQKSFAIMARSKYGPSTMKYSFFDNRPFTEYKSILLRQGGQDQLVAKIKEVVAQTLVEGKGLNFLNQAWKPYVVYINGEYWGVYFMMEKRSENFIAQHEGVDDPDNMNIMWSTGNLIQGSDKGYKELLSYIGSHDMSKEENYDYLADRVDTDSFMDEMINEIWVANSDYGNIEYYQLLPGGKWKQIYYDFCWTFGSNAYPNGDHPTLTMRMDNTKAGSSIFNALLAYKPWRDKFIERFAWTLKNIYQPDHVIAVIDEIADMVRDEMPAERAKFGGTVESWEANVESMRNFAKKRGANIVAQLKSTFSLSQDQIQMLEDAIDY